VSELYLQAPRELLGTEALRAVDNYYAAMQDVLTRLERVENALNEAKNMADCDKILLEFSIDVNPANHVVVTGETYVQHPTQPEAQ
jgi:hypothetical protein